MAKASGLEGIVVGDTAISTVGKTGVGLTYRGYSIEDLAQYASFEEVAYLLVYKKLPSSEELSTYKKKLKSKRTPPPLLKTLLEYIPRESHPMDVLRTACSMLGNFEPESASNTAEDIANRFLACIPSILLYWYQFHKRGIRIQFDSSEESVSGYFLELLYQDAPAPDFKHVFDISLILYAEHEYNASTFAARVTTSTESDFYSAIVTGIGTLRGPLHGGANEAAMDLIQQFKTGAAATIKVKEMLQKKEKIMGFGHRVYKISDPRSDIIKKWSQKLSTKAKDGYLFEVSEAIEKVLKDEKKLFPNLDFYSATAYHFCGVPTSLFTPIFALSRITGWTAHILEQRANNRLIRPEANYTGPQELAYISLDKREVMA